MYLEIQNSQVGNEELNFNDHSEAKKRFSQFTIISLVDL